MSTVTDILALTTITLTFSASGVALMMLGARVRHKANEAVFNRTNQYGVMQYASYNEMLDFEAWNNWKYRMGSLALTVGGALCIFALFGMAGLIKAIQAF